MSGLEIDFVRQKSRYTDDEENPGREGVDTRITDRAAYERMQAFLASGVARGLADDLHSPGVGKKTLSCERPSDYEHYDFDGCGTDPVLGSKVLWSKQQSDEDLPGLGDVKQRELGDCSLMATLGALTLSPQGRELLKAAVTENRSDSGEVTYTVRLHEPSPGFAEKRVTVGSDFAHGHAAPNRTDGADGASFEVWPLVVERAYATLRGGYNAIGRGGTPTDAMEALTGKPAVRVDLAWPRYQPSPLGADIPGTVQPAYTEEELRADLAARKMVVLETKVHTGETNVKHAGATEEEKKHLEAHYLMGNHAYVVTGTHERDGALFLELHNPWGRDHPTEVPFHELQQWFKAVDVGSVN
jgi:hypothetical protein